MHISNMFLIVCVYIAYDWCDLARCIWDWTLGNVQVLQGDEGMIQGVCKHMIDTKRCKGAIICIVKLEGYPIRALTYYASY